MAFAGQTTGAGFGGEVDETGFASEIPSGVAFGQLEMERREKAQETRLEIIESIQKKINTEVKELDDETQAGMDAFADDFLNRVGAQELDHASQDKIAQLMTKSMLLDNLDHLNDTFDQDFVSQSVMKYGINPFDEGDVQLGTSVDEYKQILGDEIQSEFNNLFDAIGKVFKGLNMEGDAVFDDLEAYTDVVRAIIDDDPRYLTKAVEEKLGLEFDDQGNFDLANTLKDNLSPIIGRYMSNLVVKPLVRKMSRYAGNALGIEVEEGILTAELAENQALKQTSKVVAETLGEFMGEGLGTDVVADFATLGMEGFAPLFVATGVLEGIGALSELSASLLGSVNMKHRAYTEGNHRWFGQDQEWLRYTGPVYSAMKGVADLNMELRDYQDWVAGTTTYQQYTEDKLLHDITHSAFQEAMEHIAKGETLSFDKTRQLAGEVPIQGGGDKWDRLLAKVLPDDVQDGIGAVPYIGGVLKQFLDGSKSRASPRSQADYLNHADELGRYFKDIVDGVVDMDYDIDLIQNTGINLNDYVSQQQDAVQLEQLDLINEMLGQADVSIDQIDEAEQQQRDLITRYQKRMNRKRDFGFYRGQQGKIEEETDNELIRQTQRTLQDLTNMKSGLLDQMRVIQTERNDQERLLEATGVRPKSQQELMRLYNQDKTRFESGRDTMTNLRARLYKEFIDQGLSPAQARDRAFTQVSDDFVLRHYDVERSSLERTFKSYESWLRDYNTGLREYLEQYY